MWFLTFLLTLLLSLIIYCVPVLIYRFGIRHGAPLESKWKATWVGWIFWVCSFTALCLYYLIAGYYDDGDFSVRAGIPDYLCMGINWFLLYFPFNRTAQSKPKCTKCGAPLSPNAKFCTECGEKFVPKPVVNTMICPGCGKTIKPTNFCPECGHHLTTTDQAVNQIGKYSKPKSTTVPAGMIVCPGCCNTVTKGKRCPLCNHQLEDDKPPRDPTFHEMFGDDNKIQVKKSKYKPDPDLDSGDRYIFIGALICVIFVGLLVALGMYLAS